MRKYKQISLETRQRICHILENDLQDRKSVANTFEIPYSTVCDIFNQYIKEGSVRVPNRGGNRPRKLNEVERQLIQNWISEDCTVSLSELRRKLLDHCQKDASLETIRRCIKDFNFSIKRVKLVAAAAESDQLWQARLQYSLWFAESDYASGKYKVFTCIFPVL
jgi:transposase